MRDEEAKRFSTKTGQLRLWTGFLLPPVVWAAQLQTTYLLIESACAGGNFVPVHVTSIIAMLLSLVGGFVSWQNFLAAGIEGDNKALGAVPRSRFMAILGLFACSLFTLVIFVQWLPVLLGVPCEK